MRSHLENLTGGCVKAHAGYEFHYIPHAQVIAVELPRGQLQARVGFGVVRWEGFQLFPRSPTPHPPKPRLRTPFTGANDTGKSSLIKSIYYAFGAEPRMLRSWKSTASKLLVYFSVDDTKYRLLRNDSSFTIFDTAGTPIESFTSVTNGLGPYLAKIFQFGVKLTSQSGDTITPPPAYLFLPFYFDQDKGWTDNWNGFETLKQLKNWKRDLIEYHVGLKPNAYYSVKGQHLKTKALMEAAQAQAKVLKAVRDQINQKYEELAFEIDLQAFQEEIKELLVLCATLQKAADRLKDKLVDLYNEKMEIESQIEIVRSALSEMSSDYKFLETLDDHVDCPTCGAAYDVSFSEIFGIALDEGKCEELLQKLQTDLLNITHRIDKMSGEHRAHDLETARIRTLLSKKREQVELKDLIDSESKKKLKSVLQSNFDEANKKTFEIQEEIDALRRQLDSFTSKERKDEINAEFKALMRRYLFDLSVAGLTEDMYRDFTTQVKDQGSDQPRAVLAYGFSILHLMTKRCSSVYCPIIIDSPIQQEQDAVNHVRILQFIKRTQPEGSQLIVGVVDTKGVDFDADVITLRDKRHVLQKEEYSAAYAEVAPFIRTSLEFRPPQHGLL